MESSGTSAGAVFNILHATGYDHTICQYFYVRLKDVLWRLPLPLQIAIPQALTYMPYIFGRSSVGEGVFGIETKEVKESRDARLRKIKVYALLKCLKPVALYYLQDDYLDPDFQPPEESDIPESHQAEWRKTPFSISLTSLSPSWTTTIKSVIPVVMLECYSIWERLRLLEFLRSGSFTNPLLQICGLQQVPREHPRYRAVEVLMKYTMTASVILRIHEAISRVFRSYSRARRMDPLHCYWQFQLKSQMARQQRDDVTPTNHTRDAMSTCSICTEATRSPSCVPCGHVFCWDCVSQWIMKSKTCPTCRKPCKPTDVLSLAF